MGGVTHAIAVIPRMADDPKKREDWVEWACLVIFLFTLIPVAGGVIKGVGRILLKVGAEAAANSRHMADIIAVLNRLGTGDAVKFIQRLDLMHYQAELLGK